MITGTWKVTVTRRDGSEHHYTEHRGRAPQFHEIIEIRDTAARPILARITTFNHTPPHDAGLGTWQIIATEI